MKDQSTDWVKINASTWRFDQGKNHAQVSLFSDGWRIYINDKHACLNTTPVLSKKEAQKMAKNALINL